MCPTPKPIKNLVPTPNEMPEKAPEPVPIAVDKGSETKRRGRNSLRIDLASGAGRSGVNV